MNELIRVTQLPVIEERLRSMKDQVDKTVGDAMSLVCTEETVQTVKSIRAGLNNQFKELEEQRKAVKAAVLGPYEQFERVYRECVSDRFRQADGELKGKIDAVETAIKSRCEAELRDYFAELCAARHIDFLKFEQAGIRVDMASAKAKTPKKLREQLSSFVDGVAHGTELISAMESAEEIMVEFKRTLDAAAAVSIVHERHRRIEAEKEAQAAMEAARERERQAVDKVDAVAPPVPVAPPAEQETVLRCAFTVYATKTQLRKLKKFLNQEGIRYE